MISVYRLIGGEEVIGTVMEEDDTSILLRKPRVLVFQQTPDGRTAPVLIPWFISNPDGNATLLVSAIAGMSETTSDVERVYVQSTSRLDLTTKESDLILR